MIHAQWWRLIARLGGRRPRPMSVTGWGAFPPLAPSLVGVGPGTDGRSRAWRGPDPQPHRIFGRHKETGPADPEGAAGAEEPPGDPSEDALPPDSPGEPAAAGLDLPEWAVPAVEMIDQGAASEAVPDPSPGWSAADAGSPTPTTDWSTEAWADPSATVAELGSADEPDEPGESALGWRERRPRRSWSRAGSAPAAGAGVTEEDGEADAAAAPGASQPVVSEEVVEMGEPGLSGEPTAADDADVDAPVEAPPATFGVPEDPTLLLRPVSGGPPEPALSPPADAPGTNEVPAATPEDLLVIDLTPTAPPAEPRAFPLPEGEVVFRNLRTAFTDPSRLLRHLASDGHTGVLEIISGSDRSSYVVLLEGAVVAVALETDGVVRTTNRVGFPAFPDGQDTLNVFRYPADVARGLGLLLHAPVHFSGLGAVFVDLDGLRSYLETRRADGGLVVTDGGEIGVALFEAGKLVGAYTASERTLGDLERIRPLVAKPEAEIDVRMGGPAEPPTIALDELLRGLGR